METGILIIFILGYLFIAFENITRVNKAAFALITGVVCWWLIFLHSPETPAILSKIGEKMGDISSILFFLIGAMTIVELIDLHNGFDLIVKTIKAKSNISLLWIVSGITFFLSPLLDNLTTTIVMISILQKILPPGRDRLYISSAIVLAANAGGAWSPIGDVTTSMLWIGGQLTAWNMISRLFLPSIVSLLIPVWIIGFSLKKHSIARKDILKEDGTEREGQVIFFSGIGLLLMVPIMKSLLHLPPFM